MSSIEATAYLTKMNTVVLGKVGEWFQFGIAERNTDHLIGDIGICIQDAEDRHAELGFTLAGPWQGRGLASEAVREALSMLFKHTDIVRVVAVSDTRNHASVKLLQRVGMNLLWTVNNVFRGEPCTEHVFTVGRAH